MPLFRDTVALEACPARTAETVSYVATFSVLGWLLLSNYSGFSDTQGTDLSIANNTASPSSTPTLVKLSLSPADEAEDVSNATESINTDLAALAPAWIANIEPYQRPENGPAQRAFSAEQWSTETNTPQLGGYTQTLELPLPLIEYSYSLPETTDLQLAVGASPDAGESAQTGLIREVTVTATESERLSQRADNIQRPQIPRPYRAQDLQRSFVLPPRIQALKP